MSIVYTNFWPGVIKFTIIEKIIEYFNIKIKKNIIIYSKFGLEKKYLHEKYNNFLKIFYTAESKLTESNANYVIGFKPTSENYIQLLPFERVDKVRYGLDFKLYQTLNSNWKLKKKTKFCCFIVSNPLCNKRNKFFKLLNNYKKVDSLGKYENNCDLLKNIENYDSNEYYNIISQYKFIICFENKSKPYYLTEKIYNSYKSNTVPIYWGDPHVTNIFNAKTFINIGKYSDFDKYIDLIKLLDNNDELYNEFFKHKPIVEPKLHDDRVNDNIKKIRNLLTS